MTAQRRNQEPGHEPSEQNGVTVSNCVDIIGSHPRAIHHAPTAPYNPNIAVIVIVSGNVKSFPLLNVI